jgi:SSS family solute:Na+ symporter
MKVESMFRLGYLATLTGMAVTAVLWVVVTLLTKPDDMAILKEFYLRARPLGFWGPVRRACADSATARPRGLILKGFLISILGFAAAVMLILGISNFYVGRFGLGSMLLAGFVGTGVAFLKLFSRYFQLIGDSHPSQTRLRPALNSKKS